jgi:cyclase
LDVKGPNLVKGVHLEGLRVLGPPDEFALHYYREGADEILYIDAVASLYGRNGLLDLVRRTAERVFVPITVGGGIRSVEDARQALRAGADKVAINTAAIGNPKLIEEVADIFGCSTVVISIAAIKQAEGRWEAYTDGGREHSHRDVVEWAVEATTRGAGEVLITSIDREGTGKGFDLALVEAVCNAVAVPVIASGGAGNVEHVRPLVGEAGPTGVSLASILHYDALDRGAISRASTTGEGNRDFVSSGGRNSRIRPASLASVKDILRMEGAWTRPVVPDGSA